MNKIVALLSLAASVSLGAYAGEEAMPAPKHEEAKVETAPEVSKSSKFSSKKEEAGYVFGAAAAAQILRNYVVGEDVDAADVLNGFKDALAGTSKVNDDEIDQALVSIFETVNTPAHWKKLNENFLAANAKKEGVKTTATGLQYKVIVEGTGDAPKDTDAVNAFYKGKFINGMEFDSSYRHGKDPANFGVNKVIAGWTEALKLMKPGAKWKLFVPANLAYGSDPKNGMHPDSVLIFDIELVDIGPPKNSNAHNSHAQQAK